MKTEPSKVEGEGGQRRFDSDMDIMNDEDAFQHVFNMSNQNIVISEEAVKIISSKFNLTEA